MGRKREYYMMFGDANQYQANVSYSHGCPDKRQVIEVRACEAAALPASALETDELQRLKDEAMPIGSPMQKQSTVAVAMGSLEPVD